MEGMPHPLCWLSIASICPVWAQGNPPPLVFSLPHFVLYLLVSFTSPFLPSLLTSYIFLLFHPFSFYQNSPTPFSGRMSQEATKPGFSFFVFDFVLRVAVHP